MTWFFNVLGSNVLVHWIEPKSCFGQSMTLTVFIFPTSIYFHAGSWLVFWVEIVVTALEVVFKPTRKKLHCVLCKRRQGFNPCPIQFLLHSVCWGHPYYTVPFFAFKLEGFQNYAEIFHRNIVTRKIVRPKKTAQGFKKRHTIIVCAYIHIGQVRIMHKWIAA